MDQGFRIRCILDRIRSDIRKKCHRYHVLLIPENMRRQYWRISAYPGLFKRPSDFTSFAFKLIEYLHSTQMLLTMTMGSACLKLMPIVLLWRCSRFRLDRLSPSIFRRPPPSRTSSFSLVPSGLITDNENETNEWPALIYDPCDMSHERFLREFF